MILDRLVEYTKSRVSSNGVLTWSFTRGQVIPLFRRTVRAVIADLDEALPGLKFRKVKPSGRTDLLIGYGDLPPGAVAAAVWTDVRWEIRLPERYLSTTVIRHELGHVLGLDHVPMGSRSIMAPSWNGYSDYTKSDLAELRSVWST